MAGQFIKAGLPAGLTVPSVTRFFTPMKATTEFPPTNQRTLVLFVHTADLVTFMPSTQSFLVTPLVTHECSVFTFKTGTWKLLCSEGASAGND